MSRFVMYTGGLGPYAEVNGREFPEKIVVEVEEKEFPVFFRRRKFIEVKGVLLMKNTENPEFLAVNTNSVERNRH